MTERNRVLIVEADDELRQILMEQVPVEGDFIVEEVVSGIEAIDRAKEQYFDVIILAVDLPDMDGWEVCRAMRFASIKTPIILLIGSDTEADENLGFDVGPNDYLTKPFKIGVLLGRLRAQIRQHEQIQYVVFQIGPYSFRPAAKIMVNNETEKKVRLTDKETAMVKFLYLAGERVVGREELLGEVWGYNTNVTTHTLETHVYRLRQKIERKPSSAELLVTEPDGYRLIP